MKISGIFENIKSRTVKRKNDKQAQNRSALYNDREGEKPYIQGVYYPAKTNISHALGKALALADEAKEVEAAGRKYADIAKKPHRKLMDSAIDEYALFNVQKRLDGTVEKAGVCEYETKRRKNPYFYEIEFTFDGKNPHKIMRARQMADAPDVLIQDFSEKESFFAKNVDLNPAKPYVEAESAVILDNKKRPLCLYEGYKTAYGDLHQKSAKNIFVFEKGGARKLKTNSEEHEEALFQAPIAGQFTHF